MGEKERTPQQRALSAYVRYVVVSKGGDAKTAHLLERLHGGNGDAKRTYQFVICKDTAICEKLMVWLEFGFAKLTDADFGLLSLRCDDSFQPWHKNPNQRATAVYLQ